MLQPTRLQFAQLHFATMPVAISLVATKPVAVTSVAINSVAISLVAINSVAISLVAKKLVANNCNQLLITITSHTSVDINPRVLGFGP